MSDDAQISRARALFKSFHQRDPRPSELVTIPLPEGPVVALEVGAAVGIAYLASGTGEKFYHEFDSRGRPKLYVTPGGEQAYLVGGKYRFTDRGFIK